MIDAELRLTLHLLGPFLTQSSSIGAYGVDAPIARNGGRCYLPGTLVKGKLREAWQQLITGNKKETGNANWSPQRARLRFSDLIENRDRDFRASYRICIDSDRGSVAKGAYLVMETPHLSGEPIEFTGTVTLLAKDAEELKAIAHYVTAGLKWIASYGSERSIGFGRVDAVAVEIVRQTAIAPVAASAGNQVRFGLEIKPQSPFCLGRKRVSDNLFESETFISGGVIKGCVATTWLSLLGHQRSKPIVSGLDPSRPDLCQHFEKIRFTHAFPAPENARIRPIVPPLSRVHVAWGEKEEGWFDVALCGKPGLIRGEAPEFFPDWKSASAAQAFQHFGHPDIKRELRVRTAIDSGKRRAKDEELFAYEMVVPDCLIWLSEVDLSGVPEGDRPKVESQLRSLLDLGLRGLGKTKAFANSTINPSKLTHKFPSSTGLIEGVWVVTLQTPALLCNPKQLTGMEWRSLAASYAATWAELSNHTLEFDGRFFATQSLAGGDYIHHRFRSGQDAYYPFLLTDPGSVFLLRPAGEPGPAQKCIENWLQHGLPAPKWAVKTYGASTSDPDALAWDRCPYTRENGYGEIAVNLPSHVDERPEAESFHELTVIS